MLRASTLAATIVAALVVTSSAAASVRVRVEGPTSTLFGALEPRLGGSRANLTALDALALTRVSFHTRPFRVAKRLPSTWSTAPLATVAAPKSSWEMTR